MLTEKSWSPPAVSVWALPSFLLESSVLLSEQPSYDECNPALLQDPLRIWRTVTGRRRGSPLTSPWARGVPWPSPST